MEMNKKTVNKSGIKNFNWGELVPIAVLVLIFVFFQIVTKGKLISKKSSMLMLNSIMTLMIGGIGVLFLMSQGNIDLSIGSIACIAAALAAKTAQNSGIVMPFVVAILIGIIVGTLNGFIVTVFSVPPFIATIGMSFMIKGLVSILLDGGAVGLPMEMQWWSGKTVKYVVLGFVILIGFILFNYTRFGKYSRAIGSNPKAAKNAGISLTKYRVLGYVVSGLLASLAGFFMLVRGNTASEYTGANFEFDVLIAIVLGGLPISGGWSVKFRNIVIGVLAMTCISNGLTMWRVDSIMQQLIKGAILIVAVAISFDRKNTTVIK